MFGESTNVAPVVLEPLNETTAVPHSNWGNNNGGEIQFEVDVSAQKLRFREFLRNYRSENVFIYREMLLRRWNRNEFFVDVNLSHLHEFDEVLYNCLLSRPADTISYFEAASKEALKLSLTADNQELLNQSNVPEFQIILHSDMASQSLRTLTAEHANTLLKVPGIVISCSKTRSKAVEICVKCSKCQNVKRLPCRTPMAGVAIPGKCDRAAAPGEACGPGTYVIMADQCEYVDQQTLKLQESPEVVPTGEMPRHILLSADRYLVDRVTPGTRVMALGVVSLYTNAQNVKRSVSGASGGGNQSIKNFYLRVVGFEISGDGSGRASASNFTPAEEEEMRRLARDPEIYEKLARSIAPQIRGDYTVDIKKALACLLMGGSRKVLADGVRLRGDINVLLMGDPSTAKSQFLKFVETVAPIGVYTSGKGSSAAGLTASVIKDSKGEFYLEGGAMVLADGGVICIDEFDKMRETDRVAIHEAMEQQTISIAKAGITTMLNCRNSVLAAANPIFGRYDDLKDVSENINLMTTILSRFDCIFIVRDIREMERDRAIARHVLGVHISSSLAQGSEAAQAVDIPPPVLKKFITYCRERCAPRLNEEASALLSSQFVSIRNQVREQMIARPHDAQAVPITIRQLEAIVRISESLAKMRLSAEATVNDVEEALRLFKVSTLAASQSNPAIGAALGGGSSKEVQLAEEFLRRRLGLRVTVSTKKVIEEAQIQGYANDTVHTAIRAMVVRNELQELNQGKIIRRLR